MKTTVNLKHKLLRLQGVIARLKVMGKPIPELLTLEFDEVKQQLNQRGA